MRLKLLSTIGVISYSLLFTGCGDTFKDDNKASTDNKTPISKFSDYATNSQKWTKVETLFGADPAVDPALSVQHGTKKLFRTIYKSPKNASIGTDGYYPNGTMFVKELRMDDDGDLGGLAGSTTVMIKENAQWTFIKLTPDLKTIEAKGTQDGTNEVGSVAGCIGCHSQADESNDFTFPPSKPITDMEKSLEDFKSYQGWTLIEEIRGIDPAGVISDKHGNGDNLFRRIYKKQLTPKVDGEYPVGTIFLKELRKPKAEDNNTIGELAGAITVMVKRGSEFNGNSKGQNWEYFMADVNLSNVIKQGDGTDEATIGCFNCHTIAQSIEPKKENNDFIFPRTSTENTAPVVIPKEDDNELKISLGKDIFTNQCSFCHGNNAEGSSSRPRLNNQSTATLKEKLTARKNGTAGTSQMQGVASGLSEEDIENVTLFIPTLNQ